MPHVELTSPGVMPEYSDLFFSWDKPRFKEARKSGRGTDAERAGALQDATRFIADFPITHACFRSPAAYDLAADFLRRL